MSDQKSKKTNKESEEEVIDATETVETPDETVSTDEVVTGEEVTDTPVDGETIVLDDADGTEVVEEDPSYATPNADAADEDSLVPDPKYATPNATSSLLNLESLINGYIVDIEKLSEQYKTQREMFNDAFNNDAEYSQIMTKVKEVNRVKSAAKQRIMKMPNVVELNNKMREYKEEMKDIQEGLSQYLQQYQQLSGANQITSDNGEVRQIVNVAKLVKKRA